MNPEVGDAVSRLVGRTCATCRAILGRKPQDFESLLCFGALRPPCCQIMSSLVNSMVFVTRPYRTKSSRDPWTGQAREGQAFSQV